MRREEQYVYMELSRSLTQAVEGRYTDVRTYCAYQVYRQGIVISGQHGNHLSSPSGRFGDFFAFKLVECARSRAHTGKESEKISCDAHDIHVFEHAQPRAYAATGSAILCFPNMIKLHILGGLPRRENDGVFSQRRTHTSLLLPARTNVVDFLCRPHTSHGEHAFRPSSISSGDTARAARSVSR